MAGYLKLVAEQLGVPVFLFVILAVWSILWKSLALWKSARKSHTAWFIVLSITNTLGILEILYIYIFSECCKKRSVQKQGTRRKRKR